MAQKIERHNAPWLLGSKQMSLGNCVAESSFSETSSTRVPTSTQNVFVLLTYTLESRREQLTELFFQRSVLPKSSYLHYLLPDKRDSVITDRLRHAKTNKSLLIKTEKFRNLLTPYCLNHMISTPVVNYVIYTNCCHRHWTLQYNTIQVYLYGSHQLD